MTYKIFYSPEALEDLRQIREYISVDLDNKQSASKIISNIIGRVEQLKTLPEIGAPLSSRIDIKTDHRYLVCGNYIVFYRFGGEAVRITRILNARQNFTDILFDGK